MAVAAGMNVVHLALIGPDFVRAVPSDDDAQAEQTRCRYLLTSSLPLHHRLYLFAAVWTNQSLRGPLCDACLRIVQVLNQFGLLVCILIDVRLPPGSLLLLLLHRSEVLVLQAVANVVVTCLPVALVRGVASSHFGLFFKCLLTSFSFRRGFNDD